MLRTKIELEINEKVWNVPPSFYAINFIMERIDEQECRWTKKGLNLFE